MAHCRLKQRLGVVWGWQGHRGKLCQPPVIITQLCITDLCVYLARRQEYFIASKEKRKTLILADLTLQAKIFSP